ncbi:MAG: single-stranded DNA-binding protein [Tepidiforma sp.]|uniref:single-stranded DNA-binding protein n=1 Tax=Tepidiforma sp. TaxID=2682230 RepID=UPI00260D014C|nr:single-stranded DNA-binding protein [Tepidiforma sp.]MCX7618855.1 single-stranded DNA-binding protein [Tepidiforma sp.]
MAGLNKILLIGNAGRDAELRYLSSGTPQCQFSLAVNNRRKNQQTGEWEDQTEWFNIVVWGDTAERVSQYITKGKQLFIEGRVQTRSWEDDQGQKHYRTEVIAQNLQLLGGPRDQPAGDDWGNGGSSRSRFAPRGDIDEPGYGRPRGGSIPREDVDVDDLPFE